MNDLIIDGNSLFARCWFAVKCDPREALRLSVASILQLLDQEQTGRLGVPIARTLFGWDGRSKTNKKRDPKPPEYIETRRLFQEVVLVLFNTVHGYHPWFEADDIVATAVFNSTARQVFVVSGDKDLMQLQGDNISYYDLNTKQILSPRTICRKFFVKRPSQIPLAMAIIGDSVDGIVGVPRWGPKKVQKVFEWVTDKMTFAEALKVVHREVPEHLRPFFLESLDKTLLHTDVENVPEPAPLIFCDTDEVQAMGIGGITQSYERVALQYEDRGPTLAGMIKGSGSE
jgi:5'-3' exonuclease